ncbi:MAG TPA: hypothetical protein VF478_07865, partial [Anaerolineae bacterium]
VQPIRQTYDDCIQLRHPKHFSIIGEKGNLRSRLVRFVASFGIRLGYRHQFNARQMRQAIEMHRLRDFPEAEQPNLKD